MKSMLGVRNLVQSVALRVRERTARAGNNLLKGYPAVTRWNVARMLVMGALFAAGAVMYLNMASEGKADIPIAAQNAEGTLANDAASHIGLLNDDDEWRHGAPSIDKASEESMLALSRRISPEVIEVYQRIDDEWRYGPPNINKIEATSARPISRRISPEVLEMYQRIDDEWRYGPPSISKIEAASVLTISRRISPEVLEMYQRVDDQWRYGPP
jgi:hypothetical protein